MTLEQFETIKDGEVFRAGLIEDSPSGCHMTGSGKMLRFVAVKGYADDWTVYVHWAENSFEYIRESGDKVLGKNNIVACVPCDDEVFARYRY